MENRPYCLQGKVYEGDWCDREQEKQPFAVAALCLYLGTPKFNWATEQQKLSYACIVLYYVRILYIVPHKTYLNNFSENVVRIHDVSKYAYFQLAHQKPKKTWKNNDPFKLMESVRECRKTQLRKQHNSLVFMNYALLF